MAAGPEPVEQERIAERHHSQRGGAGLWFRRCQAFNGQRWRSTFHRRLWRTALHWYGRCASFHWNSHRAALYRRRRSGTNFDLGRFCEPIHPSGQHFAIPTESFSQPFCQSLCLVGQRLRRLEQRCRR